MAAKPRRRRSVARSLRLVLTDVDPPQVIVIDPSQVPPAPMPGGGACGGLSLRAPWMLDQLFKESDRD